MSICRTITSTFRSFKLGPVLTKANDGLATLSTLQWLEFVKLMLDGKNFASNSQLTEAEHWELMGWAKNTRDGSDSSVSPTQDTGDDEPF